jgi:hypothetical protein
MARLVWLGQLGAGKKRSPDAGKRISPMERRFRAPGPDTNCWKRRMVAAGPGMTLGNGQLSIVGRWLTVI